MPRLRQRGKVGSPNPTKLSSQEADSSAAGTAAGSTALPSPSQSQSQSHIKKRLPRPVPAMTEPRDESRPLLDSQTSDESLPTMPAPSWTARNQWIVLALASGGCAAFNGVFAKLTTTELTTSLSQAIARFLGLSSVEGGIELVTRSIFFGLNLVFNGVMWALFTKALTRGNSTTQVSIINTSSNFVITAILGFAIFSESLPPLWWLGAAMLVAGNVITGRKDEGNKLEDHEDSSGPESRAEDGQGSYRPVPQADQAAPGTKEDDEDILDLELEDI
ncbi:hypothetical protein B0T16DRAFT_416457 [Cercophora newfieldiana]|uniref:Uncharacterized protein n=1 Tax=Cercophora newfieldiana TaxID=92897 RepID=A0AA40CMB8_9PEZI|nr:hypothetical protein B0T16DRAFT_416457 [Cercophora newfieldiana]